MPVLVLILRAVHRSTLHFLGAGSIVYHSFKHTEKYHIKFVKKSHHLKQHERKPFVSRCFRDHNLHLSFYLCLLPKTFLTHFTEDNMYNIIMQ